MNIDEPLVIDAETVAETLERRGFERMAGWVRNVGNTLRRQAMEFEIEQKKHQATRERLHKYEPPPPQFEDLSRWTGD